MNLLVIRHAEAVPLGHQNVETDEARYLTPTGQKQASQLAHTLHQHTPQLALILTSPLVRARQTAETIVATWPNTPPLLEETPLLAPGGRRRKIAQRLRTYAFETIALVGHNPDLSELVGWFLGDKHIGLDLEKAGVACLQFDDHPAKAAGLLVWLVTPAWCSPRS
ncbi:MAG: phosphohistidine phosphatase SixA [Gemmataceae bacterium]